MLMLSYNEIKIRCETWVDTVLPNLAMVQAATPKQIFQQVGFTAEELKGVGRFQYNIKERIIEYIEAKRLASAADSLRVAATNIGMTNPVLLAVCNEIIRLAGNA